MSAQTFPSPDLEATSPMENTISTHMTKYTLAVIEQWMD
jgi:hypothetical protein